MKPVGKLHALIGHVQFDERGRETGCCRMAQATAPFLDSTGAFRIPPQRGGGASGVTVARMRASTIVPRLRVRSAWV